MLIDRSYESVTTSMGKKNRRRQSRRKRLEASVIEQESSIGVASGVEERSDNNRPIDDSSTPLLDVGTRIEILDLTPRDGFRNTCTAGCGCTRGTISHHWVQYEEVTYSYCIRAECGSYFLIQHTDKFLQKRDLTLRFKVGDRVECCVGKNGSEYVWSPGVIIDTWCSMEKEEEGWREYPYQIRLDDTIRTYAPADEDDVIRKSDLPRVEYHLRFKVGDRVDCFVGECWKTGTIFETWCGKDGVDYTDDPYGVILDEGGKAYAPQDIDECVKRSYVDPPTCFICLENDQTEDNIIVRECACRGDINNGHVHIKCLVEFARINLDCKGIEVFTSCNICKQNFKSGGICSQALKVELFRLHDSRSLDAATHMIAKLWKCQVYVEQEKYEYAKGILQIGIQHFRSTIEQYFQGMRSQRNGSETISHEEIYALDQSSGSQCYRLLVYYLREQSRIHKITSCIDDMVKSLEEVLEIIEAIGRDSDIFTATCYAQAKADLAKVATENQEYDMAVVLLEDSVKVAREQSDFNAESLSDLLLECGYANLRVGNKNTGLEQLEEALRIQETVLGYHDCGVRETREAVELARTGYTVSQLGTKVSIDRSQTGIIAPSTYTGHVNRGF